MNLEAVQFSNEMHICVRNGKLDRFARCMQDINKTFTAVKTEDNIVL